MTKNFWRNIVYLSFIFSTQSFFADAATSNEKNYHPDKIILKGNVHLPDDSVLYYLGLNQGQNYSKAELDLMVKKAYESGFFEKISIDYSWGSNLMTVDVVEQPVISSIKFYGNRKVPDRDLAAYLKLRSGMTFSARKLKNDVERLLNLYQAKGHFNAIINPKIIEEKGGGVTIAFEIKEGKKAVIRKIAFVGNNQFSESDLKQNIISSEWAIYRFFSSAYNYDSERFKIDAELVTDYYQSRGYPYAKVVNTVTELDADNKAFVLTFFIEPGEKFSFGEVILHENFLRDKKMNLKGIFDDKKGATSLEGLPTSLKKALKNATSAQSKENNDLNSIINGAAAAGTSKETQARKPFNINTIRDLIAKLKEALARKGYAFVKIDYSLKVNPNTKAVDVIISIEETSKFFINKIDIINNSRTKDEVIRREMRVSEKDSYNLEKIELSLQRIRSLGYFREVNFIPKQIDNSDKVDLEIKVDEKRTGTAGFNVGYNTVFGSFFGLNYAESNLLGSGRGLSTGLNIGKLQKHADISLSEPYFLGLDATGGFSVFVDKETMVDRQRQAEEKSIIKTKYSSYSRGLALNTIYNLTERLRHNIEYRLKFEKINQGTVENPISEFLRPDMKNHAVSSIGHSFIYDKSDNFSSPTKGYVLSFYQNFAGLGGSARYLKHTASGAYYTPIYKDKVIMKISGSTGVMSGLSKKIRLLDNFFSEDSMIRGFDYNGIGPREKKYGQSLGGKKFFRGSLEVKFPVGLPRELGMHGVVFSDIATLYDIDVPDGIDIEKNKYLNFKKLRSSYGTGVVWDSPIGILSFNYAIPISKAKGDNQRKFNFSIGSAF